MYYPVQTRRYMDSLDNPNWRKECWRALSRMGSLSRLERLTASISPTVSYLNWGMSTPIMNSNTIENWYYDYYLVRKIRYFDHFVLDFSACIFHSMRAKGPYIKDVRTRGGEGGTWKAEKCGHGGGGCLANLDVLFKMSDLVFSGPRLMPFFWWDPHFTFSNIKMFLWITQSYVSFIGCNLLHPLQTAALWLKSGNARQRLLIT